MPSYIVFRWVEHIQNLKFSHQISIKISYNFWCLILGLIFWEFGATWCQKGRFWEPLGAQLVPKWRPKSLKWCQKGPRKYNLSHYFAPMETSTKKHNMLALFTALFPSSLSERSFIQKYYANAFGKPLNPNKKKQIQVYKDSMRQWPSSAKHHQPSIKLKAKSPGAAVLRPLAAFD